MQIEQLRIKRNTLAAESRIIKVAEQRALRKGRKRLGTNKPSDENYALFRELYHHRVNVVRRASRICHLAQAYLVDRSYNTVENVETLKHKLTEADLKGITKEVLRFGYNQVITEKDILRWTES